MATAKPYCNYTAKPTSIEQIPSVVERAVRYSTYGTPGPVYIEMAADVIYGKVDEDKIVYLPPVPELPKLVLSADAVEKTLGMLKSAKNPLIICGKGVGYADA